MSNTTKLSARERITSLLDDNSFVEIGALVTKRSTDFNLQQKEVPADGVITGYGVINDNLVYVYSQDASCLGGSIGEMHAKKIVKLYDLALKVGAPIIGFIDCAGLRLQEATDALNAFGEIYLKQTMASGVIPQISAVFGTCGGGATVLTALSDFTFMESKNGKLFVNAPNAIEGNYIEKCDTSAASFQAETGCVDVILESDYEVINKVRELVSILPNNEEDTVYDECTDDLNRLVSMMECKDTKRALMDISDQNFFFEVKASYAPEMVTGFIRLNGMTVGAVANRGAICDDDLKVVSTFDGSLTTAGCYKAESFVKFCDSFSIPVLTLTDVNGFKATVDEEKKIAIACAKLTYAFANATVPKINVIVGKAYGSAYLAMNSKHIGADMVFALPGTEIGMMDGKLAAQIMYANDKISKDDLDKKAATYTSLQNSSESAAKRGYVDTIIEACSVRKHVIYALEMLFTKKEDRPYKKHGTK